MARVSTHILDTSRGTPAGGVNVELHLLLHGERQRLATAVTNEDGRTAVPLLTADRIEPGTYELTFHAGAYFRRVNAPLTEPAFLDIILIRFGVSDPQGHYHVPLLLSPYGYSTYRGS